MSTAECTSKCKLCGGVVSEFWDSHIQKTAKTCLKCGYHKSKEMKFDDNGCAVLDENGNAVYLYEEIVNPVGAYRIAF